MNYLVACRIDILKNVENFLKSHVLLSAIIRYMIHIDRPT